MDRLASLRYVSFSSAGTQGFLFQGAVTAIERSMGSAWMDALEGVAGCSAGTIAMLMLVLKLPRATRERILADVRFDHLFSTAELAGVPEHLGAFRLTEVRRIVREILQCGGLSPTITLEAMHNFVRKRCVFVATDVTAMTCVHLSHETHPSLSVVDAVCASCAIPLLFRPILIGGHLYVDGCLTQSVPDVFDRARTLFLAVQVRPDPDEEMSWQSFCNRLTSLACRTDAAIRDLVAAGHAVLAMHDSTLAVDPFLGTAEIQRMTRHGFLVGTEATHPGVRDAVCEAARAYVRNRLTVDLTTTDDEAPPRESEAAPPDAAGDA